MGGIRDSLPICYSFDISEKSRWEVYGKIIASAYKEDAAETDANFPQIVAQLMIECQKVRDLLHCTNWMNNAITTLCRSINCSGFRLNYCNNRLSELNGITSSTTTTTLQSTTKPPLPIVTLIGGFVAGFVTGFLLMIFIGCVYKKCSSKKTPKANTAPIVSNQAHQVKTENKKDNKKEKKKEKKEETKETTTTQTTRTNTGTQTTKTNTGTAI